MLCLAWIHQLHRQEHHSIQRSTIYICLNFNVCSYVQILYQIVSKQKHWERIKQRNPQFKAFNQKNIVIIIKKGVEECEIEHTISIASNQSVIRLSFRSQRIRDWRADNPTFLFSFFGFNRLGNYQLVAQELFFFFFFGKGKINNFKFEEARTFPFFFSFFGFRYWDKFLFFYFWVNLQITFSNFVQN